MRIILPILITLSWLIAAPAQQQHPPRLAVLIPIFDSPLSTPTFNWTNFLSYAITSYHLNQDVADFHLFVEPGGWRYLKRAIQDSRAAPSMSLPRNVFIHHSMRPTLRERVAAGIRQITRNAVTEPPRDPRLMSSARIAYGVIFRALLEEGPCGSTWAGSNRDVLCHTRARPYYTHWAWADYDLIFGALAPIISPFLHDPSLDIITFGKCQINLFFLNGGFTIFSTSEKATSAFKLLEDHECLVKSFQTTVGPCAYPDERMFSQVC